MLLVPWVLGPLITAITYLLCVYPFNMREHTSWISSHRVDIGLRFGCSLVSSNLRPFFYSILWPKKQHTCHYGEVALRKQGILAWLMFYIVHCTHFFCHTLLVINSTIFILIVITVSTYIIITVTIIILSVFS